MAQPGASTRRPWCAHAALTLALALLAATFLLISPPPGQTFPGQRPWGELSILKPLIDLMSLYGVAPTARGVEIKDFALHLAAVVALVLLGLSRLGARMPGDTRAARTARYGQMLLGGWVLLSVLSGFWARDPALAHGQGTLYALHVAWAAGLAHAFDRRDLPRFMLGLVVSSAVGASLCIWYFYERNPAHRPGFPLGNPTVLAATIVPGVIAAACELLGVADVRRRKAAPPAWGRAAIAAAALVPLLWCLGLTWSRGALLALVVAAGVLVVLQVGRRVRWIIAGVLAAGVLLGGWWWYHTSHLDVAMARGATIRFRLYAWGYAAQFWQSAALAGHGAGSFPAVAEQLAITDRALDPAAFMGDIVEHAHNELFEVLAEIGLVGGVTFVGGLFATVLAGALLLRPRATGLEHWQRLALVGGVIALITDSMVGVALRLPGGAAVFFTLVGVLWGVCRTSDAGPRRAARRTTSALLFAVACLVAAGAAGWVTVRNWIGVRHEQIAYAAFNVGDYTVALDKGRAAEGVLLDPVRRILARELRLRCLRAEAERAFLAWRPSPLDEPDPRRAAEAEAAALRVHAAAVELGDLVPALLRTEAVAARAAEWLYQLKRDDRPDEAQHWLQVAEAAWRRQQRLAPFDVETLLALTGYPGLMSQHLGLLRDALREGEPRGYWLETLRSLAQQPDFEPTLVSLVAACGPITPETDLDTLIASRAPEVQRVVAAWHGLRGEYDEAAAWTGRAAELYGPMRTRFPVLQSVALAEQAEYLFLAEPVQNAGQAAALLGAAIDLLPQIQQQKYEALVRPYRQRLLAALLAGGDELGARQSLVTWGTTSDQVPARLAQAYVELSRALIRRPAAQRPPVETWLRAALRHDPHNLFVWSWLAWLAAEGGDAAAVEAVLAEAAAAGVTADGTGVIRRSLCREFPPLCAGLGVAPEPAASAPAP